MELGFFYPEKNTTLSQSISCNLAYYNFRFLP
jgi:hypothetical protein